MTFRLAGFWLHNCPFMSLPVDHYLQWVFKLYMPDKIIFINSFHTIQIINIIRTFIYKGIYSKITYPEGSKILEKMCSLAWIYT